MTMFRFFLSIVVLTTLLLISALAWAGDTPPDVSGLVNTLLSAIQLRAWGVVVGAVLTLAVLLARYLQTVADIWRKVPAKWRPLVPAVIGTLATVGNALTHREQWLPILITDALVNLLPVTLAIVSPIAHLDQVILPVTASNPVVRDKLDRDTTPSGAPGG